MDLERQAFTRSDSYPYGSNGLRGKTKPASLGDRRFLQWLSWLLPRLPPREGFAYLWLVVGHNMKGGINEH